MKISRRARFESADAIAPHQFSVMAHVEKGLDRPGALAREERISAPSLTRTVNGLVERGLVESNADPDDGRARVITLTNAGKQALTDVRRSRDAWIISRIEDLTDQECQTLREAQDILSRVARA
ncbi:MarR family winged helix-turn-helix transcriptional regulator [Demetria terragena]|uniref:MarR family winged helix-turn-helix transcriptional regulator n=1 Tax=Demetria terragena TaxID=63959 RepID=UPI0003AA9789|nr:MarR family winged helix-turn-helix transcriptional regulator [Demetria terragena]